MYVTVGSQSHTYPSADERLDVFKLPALLCNSEAASETKLAGLLKVLRWACPMHLLIAGLNSDDFLAVGLRNRRVVYSYNLGSGIASISSDPLDPSLGIHTVHLGRFLRMGWLKVKSHPFVCPSDFSVPVQYLVGSVQRPEAVPRVPTKFTNQCTTWRTRGMMSIKWHGNR